MRRRESVLRMTSSDQRPSTAGGHRAGRRSLRPMNDGARPASAAAISPVGGIELIDVTAPAVSSFEEFYASNAATVGRALALTLGDHALGLEAADEAFTRCYERWGKVSGYSNPAGWVYTVGLNWARSWLRRKARAVARQANLSKSTLVTEPTLSAESVTGAISDPALRAALMELSVEHRSVVVLRYFLDWSTDMTADALDISPGTVKSRLSRGLDNLRRSLAAESSSDD